MSAFFSGFSREKYVALRVILAVVIGFVSVAGVQAADWQVGGEDADYDSLSEALVSSQVVDGDGGCAG